MPPAGPRRPRRSSQPPGSGDLVSLAFDDAVLDRLAARTRSTGARACHRGSGEFPDSVSELFAGWQDQLTARPGPTPLDADRAAHLVASAPRRSAVRPAIATAAAICTLLVGSAAIGARTAQPGDPLFPVTQVLWTQQADSAVAGQQIRDIIALARGEVAAGRLAHAADLLREAARDLGRVTGGPAHVQAQGDLLAAWTLLGRAGAASGQELTADGRLVPSTPGASGSPIAAAAGVGAPAADAEPGQTLVDAPTPGDVDASSGAGGAASTSGRAAASPDAPAARTAATSPRPPATPAQASTPAPPAGSPSTAAPSDPAPPTAAPTSAPPTPSMPAPSTAVPPTTAAPTTAAPTTAGPPTGGTGAPTSAPGTGTPQASVTPSPTTSAGSPTSATGTADDAPAVSNQAMLLPAPTASSATASSAAPSPSGG